MEDKLFEELLGSVREAGAIRRGEKLPSRQFRYVGPVLVEVEEEGEVMWRIGTAIKDPASLVVDGHIDPRALREALRQRQTAMAVLLGVSVGTWRGWEQGRRSPRGPARRLLEIATKNPQALLDAGRAFEAAKFESAA